jgi:DNA repair exonuclease SbcCD ATPase subunit
MAEDDELDEQGLGGIGEDVGGLLAAEGDAPDERCRYCGDPLPTAAVAGGPGRRREYHRKGESRDGRDCKEAARRARASAVGSATEQPLQALLAWSITEETARRAHAQELRAAADRDVVLADDLADLRATVLARNSELEEQAIRDRADLTEAETRATAAERREKRAIEEARTAVGGARAETARARERADAAERAAELHQTARETAERETKLVERNRDELREQLERTRGDLADLNARLTAVTQQLETARADLNARGTQLEQVTAELAEARQRLTETGAALQQATADAERTKEALAEERRTAAEYLRTAEQASARATQTAESARAERDQALTELAAAQARHDTERGGLERERDTARGDADTQRERAARAEQALTQVQAGVLARAEASSPPPEH